MKYRKLISSLFLLISFYGFAQQKFKLIAEHKFNGVANANENKNINLLVIHGTGIKPRNYADKMVKYFIKDLKTKLVTSSIVYSRTDSLITVRKISGILPNASTLNFYVLHWSDYTVDAKKDVKKSEKDNNHFRGPISKLIKNKVLITEFYDFVIFSNEVFKAEIKLAMDAAFDDLLLKNNERNSTLNLVSGSLGSSVFVEYVTLLQHEKENKIAAEKIDAVDKKLTYIEKTTTRFYMLTNQVNFLEPIIGQDMLKNFLSDKNTMQIVAFRHTNDALCFYLPQARADYFFKFMPVSVTNVRYKNFPMRNGIIKAHNKPFYLKKIYQAILYGSNSRRVKT